MLPSSHLYGAQDVTMRDTETDPGLLQRSEATLFQGTQLPQAQRETRRVWKTDDQP